MTGNILKTNKNANGVRERKKDDENAVNGPLNDGSENDKSSRQQLQLKLKEERESLLLWRHPITTLMYFILELGILCRQLVQRCVAVFVVIIIKIIIILQLYSYQVVK